MSHAEAVTLHPAAGATDTIVRFARADVIAAGDILDLRHFPIIDIANGGTINGEIDALTRLVTDYSVALTGSTALAGCSRGC